jgi:hypothetical protein
MDFFDWQYYLDKYPDLRMNGVSNKQQAITHWKTYGEREGRVSIRTPKFFDWKYYLLKYPDLRMNGVNNEQKALLHWFNHGEKEGRVSIRSPDLFDWQYYLDKYPDLRMNGIDNEQKALHHWFNHGEKEGRVSIRTSSLFDWKYYLLKYPDLPANGVNNERKALQHWFNHGRIERRIACTNTRDTHTIKDILYCQPIFAPDLERLKKNIDSLESINNYLKSNKIDITCINFSFGGWCINDEYWNIISTKIKNFFNVEAIRFNKNYGKAYVVNSLIHKAQLNISFKYILTCDSDIMFDINEPNIFERLINCVGMSECIRLLPVGLIALNQRVGNCHLECVYQNSFEFNSKYGVEKIVYPDGYGGIAGGCLFITLEGWNATGGYRVMGVYAGDDAHLLIDLTNKGMTIQMADTINCIHPHESDSKYSVWKVMACQRDQGILNITSLEDKIKEADEFWITK